MQLVTCKHVTARSSKRLDIAASGFCGGRSERTFFDVRIFNPHAPLNRHSCPTACYRNHELIKKRHYEQRVREVEHASFTPWVLSATGGMAKEATIFYKRFAYPPSGTILTVRHSAGYAVVLLFPYFALQSSASEVLVPVSDTQPDPPFHPLIWSALNSDPRLNSWPLPTHRLSLITYLF